MTARSRSRPPPLNLLEPFFRGPEACEEDQVAGTERSDVSVTRRDLRDAQQRAFRAITYEEDMGESALVRAELAELRLRLWKVGRGEGSAGIRSWRRGTRSWKRWRRTFCWSGMEQPGAGGPKILGLSWFKSFRRDVWGPHKHLRISRARHAR